MKRVYQDDPISFDEVKAMIEASDPELKSFIAFLYLTGCRISEALQVRAEDIWEEEDKINIRIPVLKTEYAGKHIVKIAKSAPFMSLILEKKAQKQIGERIWNFSQNLKSARVIIWRKLKALNPRIYPHLFRHTRLTKLAEKGATASQLQVWAGWKSIKMADIYVRRTPRMIEDLADKVD
jgi:integrase